MWKWKRIPHLYFESLSIFSFVFSSGDIVSRKLLTSNIKDSGTFSVSFTKSLCVEWYARNLLVYVVGNPNKYLFQLYGDICKIRTVAAIVMICWKQHRRQTFSWLPIILEGSICSFCIPKSEFISSNGIAEKPSRSLTMKELQCISDVKWLDDECCANRTMTTWASLCDYEIQFVSEMSMN